MNSYIPFFENFNNKIKEIELIVFSDVVETRYFSSLYESAIKSQKITNEIYKATNKRIKKVERKLQSIQKQNQQKRETLENEDDRYKIGSALNDILLKQYLTDSEKLMSIIDLKNDIKYDKKKFSKIKILISSTYGILAKSLYSVIVNYINKNGIRISPWEFSICDNKDVGNKIDENDICLFLVNVDDDLDLLTKNENRLQNHDRLQILPIFDEFRQNPVNKSHVVLNYSKLKEMSRNINHWSQEKNMPFSANIEDLFFHLIKIQENKSIVYRAGNVNRRYYLWLLDIIEKESDTTRVLNEQIVELKELVSKTEESLNKISKKVHSSINHKLSELRKTLLKSISDDSFQVSYDEEEWENHINEEINKVASEAIKEGTDSVNNSMREHVGTLKTILSKINIPALTSSFMEESFFTSFFNFTEQTVGPLIQSLLLNLLPKPFTMALSITSLICKAFSKNKVNKKKCVEKLLNKEKRAEISVKVALSFSVEIENMISTFNIMPHCLSKYYERHVKILDFCYEEYEFVVRSQLYSFFSMLGFKEHEIKDFISTVYRIPNKLLLIITCNPLIFTNQLKAILSESFPNEKVVVSSFNFEKSMASIEYLIIFLINYKRE